MMKRKRRTSEELRKDILGYLKKQTFGRTTGQVADALVINWDSAERYLKELEKEGILYYEKVGRQNQWCLMEYYENWKNRLRRLKKMELGTNI